MMKLLCSLFGTLSVELANYDESKVPACTFPPLLVCEDGTPVNSPRIWEQKRRPETLEQFCSQLYGRTPESRLKMTSEALAEDVTLHGKALRRQIRLTFSNDVDSLSYLPCGAQGLGSVRIGGLGTADYFKGWVSPVRAEKTWGYLASTR